MEQLSNELKKTALPIGEEELRKADTILRKYKSGKASLERKIVENEQWWKLRHWRYMTDKGNANDIKPASAWLFNVIINKHADGIEAFPEPNVLPREENDREEAKKLSSIIPVVLEQNDFEETYSDVTWQKLKTGTGVYGVFWDASKINGLGDITIRKMDLLNIFWEPGITDIQKSRNVFTVELVDNDILEQRYPELDGRMKGKNITLSKYIYDDNVDTTDKSVVVDWYYHKYQNGRKVLHYCKYVNTTVLYATENDTQKPITGEQIDPVSGAAVPVYGQSPAERGWYDHAEYPFIFDRLFPTEGTPCGFGYIDICKDTQSQLDHLNQAITKNAVMAATPRFFIRGDGSINEKEFADWTRPLVHVNGNLGADSIQPIAVNPLNSVYVNIMNNKIDELRETSGNTEAATGAATTGVTAASAIAALQEASGKTSRASTLSAYRAYRRLISQIIELIRQFYDLPRQFRITGDMGQEQYVSYDNSGIKPKTESAMGFDMGLRLPVFDVSVSAQKKNVYSKMQQNELALQLYNSGCFNPEMADQSLLLLDTMDFDRKEAIMQKIQQNGTMYQQLMMYQQLAMTMAEQFDPETYNRILAQVQGGTVKPPGGSEKQIEGTTEEINNGESAVTRKARERTANTTSPA